MQQSNSVRRLWCGAWLAFVAFTYLTVYSKLTDEIFRVGKQIPLVSSISIYLAMGILGLFILLPPYNKPPSQTATNFYVVGALVIAIGLGLFGMLLPLLAVLYGA